MKKQTKVITALVIISTMILSIVMSKSLAARPDNTNNYTQLSFGGGATAITDTDNGTAVTITYPNGTVSVTGAGLYSVKEQGQNGQGQNVDKYNVYATGNVTVTATPNNGYTANLWENGQDLRTATKQYTGLTAGGAPKSIDAVFEQEGSGGNVPSGPVGGPDNIDFDIKFTDTSMNVDFNGISVMSDEEGLISQFNGTKQNAGKKASTETNTFRFSVSFGEKEVKEFTINGTKYTEENTNTVTVERREGPIPGTVEIIYTIVVPGAENYVVTGTGVGDMTTPPTIIWANVDANKNAEDYMEDMVLKHGFARIIAVYDEENNKIEPNFYTNEKSDEYGLDRDGLGWACVRPNSKVVFEFTPEYGYQLTEVKANGVPLEPQETTNQYVFTMPQANIHFAATFTKTEDIVKANSEKVSEGDIKLGGNLEGGSAQLTVKDIELSADKIKGFENAVEGYTVSNYLDIDLYQVFYKGKADSDDVWSNKIDELSDEATISLKLADGLTADDIVIVHNIHDGEEYEVIEIESYDEETNTITFKTKSFSNYAIATKGEKESSSKLPKTGDSIAIIIAAGIVATLGLFVAIKMKKHSKSVK